MKFVVIAEWAVRANGRASSRWIGSVDAATADDAVRIATARWPGVRLKVTTKRQPSRPSLAYCEPDALPPNT